MPRRRVVVIVVSVVVVLAAAGVVAGYAVSRMIATSGPECTVPRPTEPAQAGTVQVGQPQSNAAASGPSGSPPTQPNHPAPPPAATPPGPLTLDAVQLQHASTIDAVGLARGVPARARVIALAAAWQESSLRNLDHGDRDSGGLFQQRPSQGWGSEQQIMDPVYAAGKFYDALLKVTGWQQMSLTKAAQAVQYSGFPDAYAKWEADAQTLAIQLGGTVTVTLSCREGAAASTAAAPVRPPLHGTTGADATLTGLLGAAQAELGGLAADSVTSDGRTATVTASLPGAPAADAGRALAAWAVAHAASMGVTTVTVQDRTWSDHAWSTTDAALPAGVVSIQVGR